MPFCEPPRVPPKGYVELSLASLLMQKDIILKHHKDVRPYLVNYRTSHDRVHSYAKNQHGHPTYLFGFRTIGEHYKTANMTSKKHLNQAKIVVPLSWLINPPSSS
jgi:hypothetical protein